jgi:ABC-type transport system substrate-binding protein
MGEEKRIHSSDRGGTGNPLGTLSDNSGEVRLAESWKMTPDGLSYQFTLRAGTEFHNGAPATAEDVKFTFEHYRRR